MTNDKWITYWRLATSEAGLPGGTFFALGLPPPDLPDFKPYSQLVPQSQGGQSEQGYQNITILWDSMDSLQVQTLSNIIAAATNNVLWATVDRAHGFGLNDFIDIQGIVRPLLFDPISKGRGVLFSNVRLTITNLTVENDPSNVFSS